jgi:ABC transport system ATP-binding/permease protein
VAHLLGGEALSVRYPTKVVLDSVTVGIASNDRIGLVGRNGEGKSTLMSILAKRATPDSGNVIARRGLQVGFLEQNDAPTRETVHASVVGDAAEHTWASDPKAREIVTGLLSDIEWSAKIGDLSGGQQRRVALASVLVQDHDVLFLDEPTNHLDVAGVTWLASHLKRRSGAVVVVTHDRWFLDEICTTTWEVHDGKVEPFEGGYAAYVLQRVERDRQAAVSEAKRQNLMRKELAWLRRGPPARTSKPKFRIDAANELIADQPPLRNEVELHRLAVGRLGKEVIELEDVSVSYNTNKVLDGIDWNIGPGDRIGILGINGSGKSTLLRLLSGELEPTIGKVKRGKTVKLAMLDQQARPLSGTLLSIVSAKNTSFKIGDKNLSATQLLERLGFSNLSASVDELSGGERRRLQLALTLLDEPNVLLMDEPSNDMDTEMLASIEDLLDTWPGTLVVISHDRYLIERVTDMQYAVVDGKLRHFPSGVEQYLEALSKTRSSAPKTQSKGGSPDRTPTNQRWEDSKELASIERKLSKLPNQIDAAEKRLSAHDQSDYEGLSKLMNELGQLREKQDKLETRWLELSGWDS